MNNEESDTINGVDPEIAKQQRKESVLNLVKVREAMLSAQLHLEQTWRQFVEAEEEYFKAHAGVMNGTLIDGMVIIPHPNAPNNSPGYKVIFYFPEVVQEVKKTEEVIETKSPKETKSKKPVKC